MLRRRRRLHRCPVQPVLRSRHLRLCPCRLEGQLASGARVDGAASLDACLRELWAAFDYQAGAQKDTGAMDAIGGLVDLPSSSCADVPKAKVRKHWEENLYDKFNEPDNFDASLAAYVGANAPNKDIPNNRRHTHTKHATGCFAASARGWRHFLRTGSRAAVIALELGTGIDAIFSAGAFCVARSGGRLRLICDRRMRNIPEQHIKQIQFPRSMRFTKTLIPKPM